MTLIETYIWLDVILDRLKEDLVPDTEIQAIELCKRLIKEKFTGYADEKVILKE